MFKHILLPLDGSPFAEAALPAVVQLASQFQSKVTLLQVVQSPAVIPHAGGSTYADVLLDLNEYAKSEVSSYLNSQKRWLESQVESVGLSIVQYEPVAEAILDAVDKLNVDTIVMSTHGRGGLSRWMYGSVADKVLRYATVPVLLIRANHEAVDADAVTVNVVDKVADRLPEAESADVLDRMIKEGEKPSMAERLIDEHMIDRKSR
ncbi:MAG: universal stress protein [Chloroflexi bacterium]|nr:universal stress protein [Chloroflexota bacterium]